MKTFSFPLIYDCPDKKCKGMLAEKGKKLVCTICKKVYTEDEIMENWINSQRGL